MKRQYTEELKKRIEFVQNILIQSKAKGIIFGNSGGKDSALVGIICKMACESTLGVLMPCESKRNFGEDMEDGQALAKQYDIEMMTVDLTQSKTMLLNSIDTLPTSAASSNVAPRLRMITLYLIAQTRGYLVAGTGNRSENYMGYFTKWGDGACDFNPIADLTATEVKEFLKELQAPENIYRKAPSAGLFEGQTDEQEMGVTYAELDEFILTGEANPRAEKIIQKAHSLTAHKRGLSVKYNTMEEK